MNYSVKACDTTIITISVALLISINKRNFNIRMLIVRCSVWGHGLRSLCRDDGALLLFALGAFSIRARHSLPGAPPRSLAFSLSLSLSLSLFLRFGPGPQFGVGVACWFV